MKYIIILLLSGCSLFKTYDVSKDFSDSVQKVCLSSEGKGRLVVGNKKYVFAYDSALEEERAQWKLALHFPLRKAEVFELDWSKDGKVEFSSTIDDKLIRENKRVNPKSLDYFTNSIGTLLQEVIEVRTKKTNKSQNYVWTTSKKSLKAKKKSGKFNAEFKNMVGDKYFGLMQIHYSDKKNQKFRMDLVVRDCFQ